MTVEFSHAMGRAWQRCEHIAQNEKIFGYDDICDTYMEMSQELRNLPNWVLQYEAELKQGEISQEDC
jgi:hypothetical protein